MPRQEPIYQEESHLYPAIGDVGVIRIGPIRQMSRDELLTLMGNHRLTTGFDIGIRLKALGGDLMAVEVSGREITGYFHEKGGYGLEACEEDVEAFLLDVTRPGTVMSIVGESSTDRGVTIVSRSSHVRGAKTISTSAIRHRRTGDDESPIMVISSPQRGRFEMGIRQKASHLHLIPKADLA